MYIYRVEDPITGFGPYSVDKKASMKKHLLEDDLCDAHDDCKYHPDMLEDCMGIAFNFRDDQTAKFFAGSDTSSQLYVWFIGFWQRLLDAGYTIRIYDVSEKYIYNGSYQVCFVRGNASIVDEISIKEFLEIYE